MWCVILGRFFKALGSIIAAESCSTTTTTTSVNRYTLSVVQSIKQLNEIYMVGIVGNCA
jgi:hypothetical protein